MPKISDARKQQRRQQILLAAASRFGRHGFQETTIQDICDEAGLSPGAIYSYFDSKEAIIAAMAELGTKLTDARMAAAGRERDPVARLRALLKEFGRPEAAKVNQYDLRIWAEAIGNRELRGIYLKKRAEVIAAFTEIGAPAAAAHKLAPDALAEFIAALVAGCEVRKAIEPSADVLPVFEVLYALLG